MYENRYEKPRASNPQKKHYRELDAPNQDHVRDVKVHHQTNHYNVHADPETLHQREIFAKEQLLLEQDGHLLEEQRYLNRLKRSELIRNQAYS